MRCLANDDVRWLVLTGMPFNHMWSISRTHKHISANECERAETLTEHSVEFIYL